jgi:RNA polymerase sigma factor (sigma-70 family)
MASPELQEFLAVLQSGDQPGIEELLRQLDPFLRQVIRMHLVDGRLRHVLSTTDIFQSLLKDFLARRAGAPAPDDRQGGLRAYLAAAVHHKVRTRMRKERRHAGNLPENQEPHDPERPASQQVEERDLLMAIRDRLSEGGRQLFDLKAQGLTWREVSETIGVPPDTLRMRLRRAVAAALDDLGHGNSGHAS